MRSFKSEPHALVIIFMLFTAVLFHFASSFHFSKVHLENTSLCSCVFLRENKKRHLWLHQGNTGIIGPLGLLMAVRVMVEANKTQGRGKTSGRESQPLPGGAFSLDRGPVCSSTSGLSPWRV